jgi:hypothetical protein
MDKRVVYCIHGGWPITDHCELELLLQRRQQRALALRQRAGPAGDNFWRAQARTGQGAAWAWPALI